MFESLGGYSGWAAKEIAAHFPQWEGNAVVEEHDGAVTILVQPPLKNIVCPLRIDIDTWGQEIIVSIDDWHEHFESVAAGGDAPDAVSFINHIIGGQFAIVSYWRDALCCGSSFVAEAHLPTGNSEYPYANLVKIRSWDGKLDRDLVCTPKD